MTRKLLFIALTFGIVLTACSSMKKSLHPNANIKGTNWSVASIISKDGNQLLYPSGDHVPTFSVAEDGKSISGFAGCNRYSGPVTIKDFTIEFGAIVATRMFCAESANIENAMLNILQDTKKYTVKGEQLVFVDDNNNIIATLNPQ